MNSFVLLSIIRLLIFWTMAEGTLQPFGRVFSLDPDIKKGQSFEVNSPVSGYRTLASWEKNEGKNIACLIYKVPSAETLGTLYYRDFSEGPCLISHLGEGQTLFNELENLKVSEISLNQNPSFKISLKKKSSPQKGESEDHAFLVYLPFYSQKNARWRGIEIYSPSPINDFLNDGEICHDFDKNCNEVGENRCHRCKDKAFSIFSNLNCPSRVFGICGRNFCGGKDQFPCLKMTSLSETLNCEDADKHMYCQHGAELECTTGGKVICR